jgi:hypothetical protein
MATAWLLDERRWSRRKLACCDFACVRSPYHAASAARKAGGNRLIFDFKRLGRCLDRGCVSISDRFLDLDRGQGLGFRTRNIGLNRS